MIEKLNLYYVHKTVYHFNLILEELKKSLEPKELKIFKKVFMMLRAETSHIEEKNRFLLS